MPPKRLAALARACTRASSTAMNFRLPLRPATADLRDRLSPRRRGGSRATRLLVLRPARLGSTAGELRRHRQGRRARQPLVPPGTAADQRGWRVDAAVVERDAVRVPDAPAGDEELSRDAAGRSRAAARYGGRSSTDASSGVPWGISESGFNAVDRHGNYQYKAFGVPGLGLKRGLGDDLVVAPYATALAAMVDPTRAAQNFRRLAREGAEGPYGFYEAVDYTHRGAAVSDEAAASASRSGPQGTVVRSFLAHHQGMTLVSLANTLLDDVMVRRFHSDPRVQATALLLQERVPRHAPITQPRPAEATRVATAIPAAALRRLPVATYAVSTRAVPLERHLCHRRHQRRRWREPLPRQGRDASPGGCDP